MTYLQKALGLAALAGTFVPTIASAQYMKAIYFNNRGSQACWVTIYSAAGHTGKLAYGCVPGNGGGLGLQIDEKERFFYVLREYKKSATSCAEHSNASTREDGPSNTSHWSI